MNGAAAIDTVLLVDLLEDYRTLLTFQDTLSREHVSPYNNTLHAKLTPLARL